MLVLPRYYSLLRDIWCSFPNTDITARVPSSGAQNCLALHHPLVECVFYDFWSGATEVEASNNADMRANDVSGAYPLFKVHIHSVELPLHRQSFWLLYYVLPA